MIWETRLVTLYSVSRVNHLSRFATAPPAGALAALPLTGAVERSEIGGRSQSVRKCARNSKCANIWTQKARLRPKCARSRFGAHLRTQITFIYAASDGTISIGATWLCNTTHSSEPPPCIWWRLTATALVEGGLLFGFPANRHRTAMASISTRAPWGCRCRRWQRGRLDGADEHVAYRASTSLNLRRSHVDLARTTCSMPVPAVSRICLMFFSAWAVCSPAVSPASSPVVGRCPADRTRTRTRWPLPPGCTRPAPQAPPTWRPLPSSRS